MALSVSTLSSSLNSIGISDAKGVDLPLLRDQNNATLPKTDSQTATTRYTASKQLTEAQQQRVAELQQIDRNVRAHEQAHIAAGHGVVTSGPNYTYTYGPDGKQYAVGGEVGIDTSYERKPEANINKGIRIQAAALAPKDPSTQDYRVASVGEQMESTGRTDLRQEQAEQQAEEQAAVAAQQAAAQKTQTEGLNGVSVSAGSGSSDSANQQGQSSNTSKLLTAYGASETQQGNVSVFA